MEEIWKILKDTTYKKDGRHNKRGGICEISNKGRARRNGIIIEGSKNNAGYCQVFGGWLHRFVAELFVSNPDNKPEIDHIDGDKTNNHATNLRWVTRKENMSNPNTKKRKKRKKYNKHKILNKNIERKENIANITMLMKTNKNNLIKITNTDTGEYRYFTKDTYVMVWTGASQSALLLIKSGTSRKFPHIKYEIVDGSEIKWKDINNIQ